MPCACLVVVCSTVAKTKVKPQNPLEGFAPTLTGLSLCFSLVRVGFHLFAPGKRAAATNSPVKASAPYTSRLFRDYSWFKCSRIPTYKKSKSPSHFSARACLEFPTPMEGRENDGGNTTVGERAEQRGLPRNLDSGFLVCGAEVW